MDKFKALLVKLDPSMPNDHNVQALHELATLWADLTQRNIRATEHLKGNKVFLMLAKLMDDNFDSWKTAFPTWIPHLLFGARVERDFPEFFPLDHLTALEKAFRKYLVSGCKCVDSFRVLALFNGVKQLLLQDDEVYNIIKSNLKLNQISFLYTLSGSEEWVVKMLHDTQLILNLLAVSDVEARKWDLFVSLAQHPDAKALLPKDVILSGYASKFERRMELCALLCSEDDLKVLQVDNEWIQASGKILDLLITTGLADQHGSYYNLMDIILPIANLSSVDALKEILGKQLIHLLVKLITEDPPASAYVTKYLPRARQEASKVLWNLAYQVNNRKLMEAEDGIDKLYKVLSNSLDPVLNKNLAGILYMFPNNPNAATPPKSEKRVNRGHVMISYNWGNQSIVKRIAKELQNRGYKVWLDVEQMSGSTLEAMAEAIEHSELVLICMSQKYKDSPNCRLEGEYCVNRKITYIPLMMQKNYRPDGWLGIALGSKLYYEFTDEANWDEKITELVKAIGHFGKSDTIGNGTCVLPELQSQQKPKAEWTDSDLLHWMEEEHIDQHYELFKKHKLRRRALLELQRRDGADKNSTFFFSLFEILGITQCGEILLLSAAIHNLK